MTKKMNRKFKNEKKLWILKNVNADIWLEEFESYELKFCYTMTSLKELKKKSMKWLRTIRQFSRKFIRRSYSIIYHNLMDHIE